MPSDICFIFFKAADTIVTVNSIELTPKIN